MWPTEAWEVIAASMRWWRSVAGGGKGGKVQRARAVVSCRAPPFFLFLTCHAAVRSSCHHVVRRTHGGWLWERGGEGVGVECGQPSTQEKAGVRVCGAPSQPPRPACGLQCRRLPSPQNCGGDGQAGTLFAAQPTLTLATCRRAVCERGARVPARPRIVGGGLCRAEKGVSRAQERRGDRGSFLVRAPPLAFFCPGNV